VAEDFLARLLSDKSLGMDLRLPSLMLSARLPRAIEAQTEPSLRTRLRCAAGKANRGTLEMAPSADCEFKFEFNAAHRLDTRWGFGVLGISI